MFSSIPRKLGIQNQGGQEVKEPEEKPGGERIGAGPASHNLTQAEKHKPICADLKPTEGHLVG